MIKNKSDFDTGGSVNRTQAQDKGKPYPAWPDTDVQSFLGDVQDDVQKNRGCQWNSVDISR